MVFNPLLANVNMVMAAGAKAESVATWEALEQAINANTNAEITINADLAANKTITIPSGKTITLKGDKTIYRASSFDDPAKFLSMFKVENGGTLNVEGNLKLSGKTAAMTEGSSNVPETKTTYSFEKVEHMDCAPIGDITADPNSFNGRHFVIKNEATNEILTVSGDGNIVKHEYLGLTFDGTEFSEADFNNLLDTDGLSNSIFETTYYGKSSMTWFFKFVNTYNGKGTGKVLSTIKEGLIATREWPVTAIDSNDSRIAEWEQNGKPGTIAATFVKKGTDNDGNQVENEFKFYYLNRRKENFLLGDDGWSRYLGTNNKSQKVVTSSKPVQPDNKYSGVEVFELVKHETEVPSQNTDKVVDPNSIEDAIFNAEDLGNPEKGGFFIHNEGGTVTVNGAVFKDMTITSGEDSPKNITPIYNNGGHFTMTAGLIENNKLDDFSDLDPNVTGRELNAQIKKHPVNNNTGAIVFENGAIGNISGGTITNNKGMIGAIKVDASELNLTGSTKITHNEGSIYTGAIFIDHEGKGVTMDGKDVEIAHNLSWRNGAVFTHLHPKDTFTPNPDGTAKIGGRFTLNAGTIHDNTSYDKGGAIRIKSNGVSLNGGEIYNNTSRVMGGAIYVDGDSPKRSRTLKLENGAIYGNKALGKDASELGGDTDVAFPKGDADGRPGYLQSGCGGGVWTCPFGTLVFNGETVNIGENSATREGQDFHKDNGLSGAVILSNMPGTWENEAGGALPSQAKPIDGVVNLTNNGSVDKNVTGVKIYNNTSRRGGGVAANGTLIFGKTEKETRNQAVLNFTKAWAEGTPKENVTFKFTIVAEDGTKTELGEYTITDATSTENSELDTFEQIAPWTVQIMLPNSYATKDGEKPFYDTTLEKGDTIKKADWKLQAEEVNTGEKYTVDYSDVTLANKETLENVSEMTDKSGNHLKTTIIFNKFTFAQTATNTKEEQLEPATLTLQATKELNGAEITSDQYKNAFQFKLTQTEGETIALPSDGVVTNDGDKINFGTLTFEKAGTYKFKYEELQDNKIEGITYDDKVDTFTVKVQKIDGKLVATNNKNKPFENATFALGTITNTYEPGKHNISISKADIDGKEIAGAKIVLTDKAGKQIDSWTSTKELHKVSLKPGEYIFKETIAPEGFEVVTDITFKVHLDGSVTVNDKQAKVNNDGVLVVTDGYSSHDINISKADIDGNEIAGAKIVLTDKAGKQIDSWTSTKELHKVSLKPGTYIFKETLAPEGFEVVTDITFTINVDGTITVNDKQAKVNNDGVLVVTDGYSSHDINISKADIDGNEIAGAKIVLTDKAGKQIDSWTSTKELHKVSLKPGTYIFKETLAPEGFEVVTDITFTVNVDGTITVNDKQAKVNNDGVLVVTDQYSVTPEPEKPVKHDINISKADIDGNEIEGAKIVLTDKAGKQIDSWTSTKELHKVSLKPGTYIFKETIAPEGFEVVTDITFTVDENGVVTVDDKQAEVNAEGVLVVTDGYSSHDINISKADIDGNEIAGAKIVLTDKAGKQIDSWTSTKELHKVSLKPGTYIFKETLAPEGFEVVTDITFTVNVDGTITVNDKQAKVNNDGVLVVTDQYSVTPEPEKPTYKDGTLATTVNVGGQTGSKDKAATIEINEDTVTTNVTDTIDYKDLFVGVEYQVTGKLMDLTTNKQVATATTTFTPQVATGTTSITFEGVTLTAGHKYVVFEYAKTTTDIEFVDGNKPHTAEHADPSDKAQTIVVNKEEPVTPEPEKPTYKDGTLATTVNVGGQTGSKDKAATIEINEDTVTTNVTDTIDYKDLFVGVEYQVTGKLMDLTTNKQVATATTTFTPQVATGTTSITFEGVTLTAGHKYVVFEY
ncbi:SpaA isopeptide-forming pilin-related protein, partial [Granulicatella balaenopterae]